MNVWDPTLRHSHRLVLAFMIFMILVAHTSMLLLKPRERAARCRKAANLLGGKVIRYEVGESVSDADLAEAAEQAARIMLAPLNRRPAADPGSRVPSA